MQRSTIYLERVVECRSSAGALWPILADTERFNRAVGLSRIAVQSLEDAGAARFLIATTLGGFRVEYEERPAEFVENERFKFLRVLRRGPVHSIETSFELRTRGSGTGVVRAMKAVTSLMRSPLLFDSTIRLKTGTPTQHRVGEDVVKDFVAGRGRPILGARANDPLRREPL